MPPERQSILPDWSERYPDPSRIRVETASMLESFRLAVVESVPDGTIAGIYAKGSSIKAWDSPIDYVPELSDVDLQVLFADAALAERYFTDLFWALEVLRRAEEYFRKMVSHPLHLPRPQITDANRLFTAEFYVPSPPGAVRVLTGLPYHLNHLSNAEVQEIDRRLLLQHQSFLTNLAREVIDKPGRYLWTALRGMSWRVGPTASRVLSILGAPYLEAWGGNRSSCVGRLLDRGEENLAVDFRDFYLFGWEYFLSGYQNSRAGQDALLAGVRVLRRGEVLATG